MRKITPDDAGKDIILERINNGIIERDIRGYFHRYRDPVGGASGMYFISVTGNARQIPYANSLKTRVWEAYVAEVTSKDVGGGSADNTANTPRVPLRKSKKSRKQRKNRKQRKTRRT